MDIVYPYRPSNWCELKYSLRSLKHIDHDKVFIIGELPDYINEDEVIFIEQYEKPGNTYDVVEKLLTICNDDRVSDKFILMNDDFYFLEDQEVKQLDFGTLEEHIERREKGHYRETLKRTYNKMKGNGIPKQIYKSFELHYPLIINKEKFKQVFARGYHKHRVVWRSVYGNKARIRSETVEEDFKFRNYNDFDKYKQKKFMSSPPMIRDSLKQFLNNKFPEKSRYER